MPNLEIARRILEAFELPESMLTSVKDRPGHDRRYAIDPGKIEGELGWRPRESWQSGLAKTIQWYRDNQPWWQSIKSGDYRKYYETQYAGR